MKIFIVHEDIYNAGNPFLYTLVEGIQKLDSSVCFGYGREKFWSDDIFSYDIVHFQWPQAFMAGDKHSFSDLKCIIKKLHDRGVRIVSTCHDLKPHYDQCSDYGDCMNLVYSTSDFIIHLGEYSKNLFEEQYPDAHHYVVPHHIYDVVYTYTPSRDEACRKLLLNPKERYILCFGTFRAEEERRIVKTIAKHYENYHILAPGFMDVYRGRSLSFIPNKSELRSYFYRYRYRIHMVGRTWNPVSDEDLPFYYAASDLCLIQRKKILNSGNAILPMLFDKVVVGPDTGNVGPILKSIGYPTFRTDDNESIINALKDGIELQNSGVAAKKHNEFLGKFSTEVISKMLLEKYNDIIAHE